MAAQAFQAIKTSFKKILSSLPPQEIDTFLSVSFREGNTSHIFLYE